MTLFDDEPIHDAVYLDLTFGDVEEWGRSQPMPRYVAEAACFDFAMGVRWLNGARVTQALIVPWKGALQ